MSQGDELPFNQRSGWGLSNVKEQAQQAQMVTVALRLPALGSLSLSVQVPLAVVTVGGFRRLRLPVGVLAGSPSQTVLVGLDVNTASGLTGRR